MSFAGSIWTIRITSSKLTSFGSLILHLYSVYSSFFSSSLSFPWSYVTNTHYLVCDILVCDRWKNISEGSFASFIS